MRGRTVPWLLTALFLVAGLAGCSDESAVVPNGDGGSGAGVMNGEIDPASGAFEISMETAGDPNRPLVGPFILRGTNVHYDETLKAVVADLTIENAGRTTFPEPIGLTFVTLLPPGVTVLNPDNDEHGPGAAIVFEFANDDGMWTPGEQSFPRTVQFGVDPAASIGFVARLDIGMDPNGGTIGGIAWLDENTNQEIDPDENGLGGIDIFLVAGNHESLTNVEILRRVKTGFDGTYRFDGLRPGFYTVFVGNNPGFRPTTPTAIQVFLIEIDGDVDDFLMANFGFIFDEKPPVIRLGDYVKVSGKLVREPSTNPNTVPLAIVARELLIVRCGNRMCVRPGVLRGPVLEVDREKRALQIMAEWVSFAGDSVPDSTSTRRMPMFELLDPDSVEVGDRVSAEVKDLDDVMDEVLTGLSLMRWSEPVEQAFGYVKRIGLSTNLTTGEIVILRNTRIIITPETKIALQDEG